MIQIPYLIREYQPEDFSHIHSSWLKSSRIHSPSQRKIPEGIYNSNMSGAIKNLIQDSKIICAISSEEKDIILSYLVYDFLYGDIPVIHYMHTKQMYQNLGLSKALFFTAFHSCDFISATFYTKDFEIYYLKKNSKKDTHKIIYNPFLLKEIG